MPNTVTITKRKVIENSAFILTARIIDAETGDPIVPADVSGVTVKSFDASTSPPTEVETATLTVADVILDPADAGYLADDDADAAINLKIPLSGDYVPEGGRTYRIEVKLTPASGDPFYVLWEVTTIPVYTE